MGLSNITLTDYDTVVAVTQDAVNESLAEFLHAQQQQVALYYIVDSNGNYVAVPEDQATLIFTGTLDYVHDQNGNPVNLVTLYTEQGNQTVAYNLTFSNAQFKSTMFGINVTQGAGAPWIIQFTVNLNLAPANIDNLPPNVQQAYQQYVNDLGQDAFTIQQLYTDLSFAAFAGYQNIIGMPDLAQVLLQGMMKAYLASLQSQGGLIFGYALQSTPKAGLPPTFAPTALDFCVTPYTDGSGNHSKPGLDTLNYLLMTNKNPLPDYPPKSFGFNWVEDTSIGGAVAIRRDLFLGYVINQLNPILQPLCPNVVVSANGNGPSIQLQTNNNSQAFRIVNPPQAVSSGSRVASFSYASNPSEAQWNSWDDSQTITASASYSMNCEIDVAGNTITLSGQITAQGVTDIEQSGGGDTTHDTTTMPSTTFTWSVQLVLTADAIANGQLDLDIANPDFDSPPSVANESESWWQQFLDTASGNWSNYTDNLQGIRGLVQSAINNILPQLQSAVTSTNHFVFPGANTFVFSNPQFSDTCDVAADTAYLAPVQPAAAEPLYAKTA